MDDPSGHVPASDARIWYHPGSEGLSKQFFVNETNSSPSFRFVEVPKASSSS
jgi:hypothetical protein